MDSGIVKHAVTSAAGPRARYKPYSDDALQHIGTSRSNACIRMHEAHTFYLVLTTTGLNLYVLYS